MKLEPTKCAVIDPLRKCFLKCKACYYLHGDMESIRPWESVKVDIDEAIARGNTHIQITGGEPSIYPDIITLIKYAKNKNLNVSMITCGIMSESKVTSMLEAGLDDFLVSIHGTEKVHDEYVQFPNARKKQIEFLTFVKGKIRPRFNCVINSTNQDDLYDIATWALEFNPAVFNFINMNPHGEWGHKPEETRKIVADLRKVEPILNKTIELLELNGCVVNLRYYPMCRIAPKYRRCVCNDLHVTFAVNDEVLGFDTNWEWDYKISPKTVDAHARWGKNTSNNMEYKGEPCNRCDLQNICGGINKQFTKCTNNSMIDAITNTGIADKNDFYYYRQHNTATLTPKQ